MSYAINVTVGIIGSIMPYHDIYGSSASEDNYSEPASILPNLKKAPQLIKLNCSLLSVSFPHGWHALFSLFNRFFLIYRLIENLCFIFNK